MDNEIPVYNRHDNVGGAGIKPGGWFVQKQDRRRLYEFHTNVDSLAFTSGNSTDKLVADLYRLSYLNSISRLHCFPGFEYISN